MTGKDGFNANGIVYNPNGYLLIDKTNDGALFKIPLQNPSKMTRISVDSQIANCDGLVIREDGSVYAILNAQNKVALLSSTDDWASAKVVSTFPTTTADAFPASRVIRDGELYVNRTGLDKLFNPNNKTIVEQFGIEKVKINQK